MIVRRTATRAWTASLGNAPRPSPGTKLRNMYWSASDRCLFNQRSNCLLFRSHLFTPQSADPGNRKVFTNTPNADIIMCISIFEYGTQRDLYYILNFTDTLCTLQLDAYIQLSLFIRPPRHLSPGLYGHIFIAIAFSNTNCLSPAATRLMWPVVRVG